MRLREFVLLVLLTSLIAARAVAQTEAEAVAETVAEAVPETVAEAVAEAEAVAVPDAEAAPPSHAPRTFALTTGYVFSPLNRLPLSASNDDARPSGVAIEGRYGWLVGGLDGSAASWVGFQTSFSALLGSSARNAFTLDYGVFAKHALTRDRPVRPFFAYGLGAAQVFVSGVDGRGIGHLTALSFGVDVHATRAFRVTLELSYRFVVLPSFATELEPAHRYDFHALRFVAGIAFGR